MNLEKNARIYAGIPEDTPQDLKYCVMDKKAKYDAFIAGANWQEQQIKKSAIYGIVAGRVKDEVFVASRWFKDDKLKPAEDIKLIIIKS